ncbi:hypothetical protein H5410_062132 [Solanum commersonii]|uniref:Protein kinase domain-containing protein n=1 Tax=Solanum commersonii TaxID=4109 RepID=A0A9J5WBQ2_SOLCO|nr:hypothetical protein H5410_062132 [Solanum commersonii]
MCCLRSRKTNKTPKREDHKVEAFQRQYGSLASTAYSYSDIKKMTNSFKEKIGEGGYGGVYKGVSHKSDVYSYGMMVLEMVGGRKNYIAERSHNSEIYFPRWAYQRILLDEELNIRDTMTNEEEEITKKMILVGWWCIQTDPLQRPAIGKVIKMLEGSLEVMQMPPKPFICSPS